MSLKAQEKFFYVNENHLLAKVETEKVRRSLNSDSYSEKAILVLCTNGSGSTNCLKIAKKMNYGYKVNLTSTKCWSEEFFDETIIANDRDLSKKEETLNTVRAFMQEKNVKFDAVVTVHEYCVQMTCYLASELGCIGMPLEVAQTIQHKYEFRKYCDQLDIVTPKYNLIKSDERQMHVDIIDFFQRATSHMDADAVCFEPELVRILTNIELPFVVKNPNGVAKG
jgi:hypothetical protein